MRAIKFRAWDIQYKRWLKAEAIGLNVKLNPIGDGCFSVLPIDDFIQLSEFTGLLDKNGKEIYEGDVVTLECRIAPYRGCPDEEMETIYRTMKVEFESGAFWLNGDGLAENCHFHYNDSEREVIGNIFESPELLSPHK